MIYIDWPYYEEHGTGSVPKEEFDAFAREATQQIDYITFNRITPEQPEAVMQQVRDCAVALVDYLWTASQMIVPGKGIITSEKVASWSTNYTVPPEMSPANKDISMYRICRRFLTRPVNLMYVGG